MSNNKFHKILSDTITLPLLPADKFNETNTGYYAVLERNYIPITSDIECIYKPDWITGYKFIKEGEKGSETNETLKYYNKLIITSISDNTTEKLRKDVMEFAVRNNVQSLTPINHIYAKVSQVPKENIEVHLEFIPTEVQNGHLNKDGGVISGDEQEIHIKYWAVLNKRNQSNVTLNLNDKLLDKDKIKSLKINSADNTVELVYLIDENIGTDKQLIFNAIFKTQYNSVNQSKTIIQKVNTYTITLDIDKPNPVGFNGDNRILTYKCTYTDGINVSPKEVKDNLYLDFSYVKDKNELKYNVIKTIYDTKSKTFKTTINVYENYTSEERQLNVKAVYNGSKKIESTPIYIIQANAKISLQYYVEYLDRNTSENPSTNGTYNVSAFGETIRLHYYGIIVIDEKNSVKITSVTNTKNNITTTYKIDVLGDKNVYNNVTLNDDEYILDINFDRNESTSITKVIKFNMNNNLNIPPASCKLTQSVLSIDLTIKQDECTEIIGGIPEYNNIILAFRAFDNEKGITIEDVNLYTITCDNDDVNLLDIQYEIITYENINYVVASNIRCKNIYDKNVDRRLTFTVKYNSKTVSHVVTQKSVVYACEIRPRSNYVSALGEDRFEVISVGIIKDGYLDKHLETSVDNVYFTYTTNDNTPGYIHVIQGNRKLLNKSQSIIKVDPQTMDGDVITTIKDIIFRIKVKYHDSTNYYDIKQLYLQIYVELYKDSSYSTLLEYEQKKLYISPFINNILYYKCYVCEINKDDGSLKKIDLSKFQVKEFPISVANWVDVQPYADENPTYNKEDYTYRGKITIPRYICPGVVIYAFMYKQGYSTINTNLYIYKKLNIYKPEIKATPDNKNTLNGTYIQYRSDNDSSYNDNKSILKIGTTDKGIPATGYPVTLYYRTVFMIVLPDDANYIYGNSYKTYIDLDKTHFQGFVNISDIIIDNNNAFSNAEEVQYNNSSYLKITFDVNKNNGLTKRPIYKSITYQFIDDTIDGTDYHYTWNPFTNYTDNDNNRIEIYQDGASLSLTAFFDNNNNAGVLSDSSRIITYNAKQQLKQNLHVRILLNGELQPTQSEYFKFKDNNTFQIDSGTLDSCLNTYKSEYNLTDLYNEPENKTYKFYYRYNGIDKDNTKTNDLTVIRTSFGRDEKCTLNAEIDKPEISNKGDTVKITFYLQYNNGEIIDLGKDAIGNFIYSLITELNSTQLKPGINNFIVSYNSTSKKYSFDYSIGPNLTTSNKTYKFIIQFGDDKHKKTLTCTQGSSSYKLNAKFDSLTLSPLSPLSPSHITVICSVEKDNDDKIYPYVQSNNFSITQTNEDETKDANGNNRLTELSTPPSGLLQGEYGKVYTVKDNKTKDPITYEFECSYNLNGQKLPANLSITQEGATFDVSIFDSETDQSKQNIVNPVGEIKTINYFGILNEEHVIEKENVTFVNETVGDGLNFMSTDGKVTEDNEYKILSRKYKFTSNTTANTITYKFTVKYQDKSKSISFTQKPGDIKLILKNEPDPIPKSGGQCKIIYYGYVGTDPNIKGNHVTTDLVLNESTEVEGFMSYTPTKVSGPTITDYQIEYIFSVPARVEDINIDKLFKRNWSVTYKNGDIQKTIDKDIVQNGDSEFFPAFDIFGLVYEWSGGKDLDTATLLTRSDNGSLIIADTDVDLCKNSFGYAQTNDDESTKVYSYIAFSGDNTHGCGYESIAINFKKLLSEFNLSKLNITLNFDIWMTWYSGRWDGKVNIKFVRYNDISFKTYSEGNIQFYRGDFNPQKSFLYLLNNDINQLDTTNSSIKITEKYTYVDSNGSATKYKTTYAKVGTLKYNTKQKTAILSINPVANSSTRASIKHTRVELDITDFYTDICYDTTYSLNNIISTNSSIQNGVTINMKMQYRDSSVATPVLKDLIYVDCSIYDIDLYNSSDHTTSSTLPRTHKYYNEILSKNIYTPTITSTNKFQIPSLDLNGIKLPAPTSFDGKTYYGLSSFYIRYMYKYNISSNNSDTFAFTKYINVNNKV